MSIKNFIIIGLLVISLFVLFGVFLYVDIILCSTKPWIVLICIPCVVYIYLFRKVNKEALELYFWE